MQGYHGRRGPRVSRSLGSLGDDPATDPLSAPSSPTTTAAAVVPSPNAAAFSLRDALNSDNMSTAAAIAMTYHGYKRTGSLLWAMIYGLAGREFPIETVPLALAQGFAQKKACP